MRGHGEGTILTRKRKRKDGTVAIGFEPMHRSFADVSRHLDGVPIVLINVSLRPPAGTVLVCKLVCI